MSGTAAAKAALIQAPIAALDATGNTGVMRIAITGSAQNFALPSALVGTRKFIALFCTADIQYAFGIGAAPTLVLSQASAPGTGHASAGATLPAGQWKDVPIPEKATHVGFIGSTGFLEMYNSQANVA
jgi:hypothetical protein